MDIFSITAIVVELGKGKERSGNGTADAHHVMDGTSVEGSPMEGPHAGGGGRKLPEGCDGGHGFLRGAVSSAISTVSRETAGKRTGVPDEGPTKERHPTDHPLPEKKG